MNREPPLKAVFYLMTIKQARKVLGKMADNITDKQLEEEIQFSTFIAELFLDYNFKLKNKIKV